MKNSFLKISAVLLILISLFFSCTVEQKKADDDEAVLPKTYSIGDTGPSGVGKVFYITSGGLHGLEAAPYLWNGGVAEPSSAWITGGATQTSSNGNTSTEIGSGLANSNAIIAQTDHAASAAKLCRIYNGGGKTDWFLPSKDELNELFTQRAAVGVFTSTFYWSSSEDDDFGAWAQNFGSSLQIAANKDNIYQVRAVRAF